MRPILPEREREKYQIKRMILTTRVFLFQLLSLKHTTFEVSFVVFFFLNKKTQQNISKESVCLSESKLTHVKIPSQPENLHNPSWDNCHMSSYPVKINIIKSYVGQCRLNVSE